MIVSVVDRFKEENLRNHFKSKIFTIVVLLFFLFVIMINTTGCTQDDTAVDDIIVSEQEEELPKDFVKVGDDGVNAAIAPDDVSIVVNKNTESMVAMSIEDTGRSDPFLPASERIDVKTKSKYDFDLMPPPEAITVDSTATDVISTKVSGIMYDNFNPSAILNISGSDYLVRTGDIINNYKILSIGKKEVTVQNGANIYKAGVGELFTGEGVNFNTISNLNNKFGGNKNSINKK